MPAYPAILFDFDGVLLDSEPIHFACWRDVLAPFGISMDWESDRDQCVGVADYQMLEYLGGRAVPPIPAERLWRQYARKNALFVERVGADPPVPADTRRLLAELDHTHKLAVVSSSARAEVEPLLKAAGLRGHFRALVCGDDVSRHKPDPEPYRLAAKLLGVETALVVEDSEPGAASGHAAGFSVVRVDSASDMARQVRRRLATTGTLY